MPEFETAAALAPYKGKSLGQSVWQVVDQSMIDAFAALSGDDNWVHIDVERAARDLEGGQTIAHGLLLLSLLPRLQRDIFSIRRRGVGLNSGYDRVRFVTPVPAGASVRLDLTLAEADPHARGTRLVLDAVLSCDRYEQPALVARNILIIADA